MGRRAPDVGEARDGAQPVTIGRCGTVLVAVLVLSASPLVTRARAAEPDLAYGAYLASECVSCHQVSGHRDGIPSIVGWAPADFTAALEAYRTKRRDNVTMQAVAARLTDDDIAALAAHFQRLGASSGDHGKSSRDKTCEENEPPARSC